MAEKGMLDRDIEDFSLELLREKIMAQVILSDYDHRKLMPQFVKDKFPHMTEDCQLKYARFKLAVAKVLKPRTIYEIGVGWGVSALAFHNGYPEADFFGIDNGEIGIDVCSTVACPCSGGHNLRVEMLDSGNLDGFVHPGGQIDLLHVDGNHGLEHKAEDIVKAIEARPKWILVDDIHNVMVAAGTFAGLYKSSYVDLTMLMFENSITGNLLIHAKRLAPGYRGLKIERS